MKKILLATTVLAATAGVAAAEVTLSGNARMGVQTLQGSQGASNATAQFYQRLRIVFSASGETDNGLSFGGSMRADQSGGNGLLQVTDANSDNIIQSNEISFSNPRNNGDSTVFISGAFGKITMGDVSGAADALVGQVSAVGFTSLNSLNEIGFLGNEKTGALYTYSAGALSFGVGLGQTSNAVGFDQTYSAAVKYSTDMYSVALGYESKGNVHLTSVSGSTTFSGATVKAKIADAQGFGNGDLAYAVSADYAMSGIGLTGFYASNRDFASNDAYGIGASYDLGGGATIRGGVVKLKNDGSPVSVDLGLNLAF